MEECRIDGVDARVLNLDQTMMPSGDYCWPHTSYEKSQRGDKGTAVPAKALKEGVTMQLCVNAEGSFFPTQVIYKGKTLKSCPKFKRKYKSAFGLDAEWQLHANENRWETTKTVQGKI